MACGACAKRAEVARRRIEERKSRETGNTPVTVKSAAQLVREAQQRSTTPGTQN